MLLNKTAFNVAWREGQEEAAAAGLLLAGILERYPTALIVADLVNCIEGAARHDPTRFVELMDEARLEASV